jgi:UDP-N-acetylglucosamine 2-epimerase (non-hydrolysing)
MKILSVIGTRPEAVKMAPVVAALKEAVGIQPRVCVTAQHRQMLDQVLELFGIQPDHDLDLMRENQSLAELSAAIFTHLDPILEEFQPDWVLAQGDTTTVAVTSLLAYYRQIRFGHVEAGLRTHDKWQPFPEEVNRRVAGVIADLHFAPTEWARQNLLREGINDEAIHVTGNPVIDALEHVADQPAPDEVLSLLKELEIDLTQRDREGQKDLVLVTAHRRENFGEPLRAICKALIELAKTEKLEIVYPVHMNPNVQEPVHQMLGKVENITLLPPLDYLPLVHLMKASRLILTDSGGIQEEAPVFGVPVLVLREVTERPEGIEAGTLKLVGTDTDKITREARQLLHDPTVYAAMARAVNPFGDGQAARRIVRALLDFQGE